jgi:hypothetical protein
MEDSLQEMFPFFNSHNFFACTVLTRTSAIYNSYRALVLNLRYNSQPVICIDFRQINDFASEIIKGGVCQLTCDRVKCETKVIV